MKGLLNVLVVALCLVLGGILLWAMLELPPPAVRLAGEVTANLDVSGIAHPVTAVLLNFRGYDTLLEVMVLFVALLGMLAQVQREGRWQQAKYRPALPFHLQALQWLARLLVPLMILTAGYLLWAGAHRAGGAFQAAAVLAGAGVVLNLAGLLPTWINLRLGLRVGLASGLLFFLAAAAAMALLPHSHLLQYPPDQAGILIVLIESGLTLSLGLILGGLFLLLPGDDTPRRSSAEE